MEVSRDLPSLLSDSRFRRQYRRMIDQQYESNRLSGDEYEELLAPLQAASDAERASACRRIPKLKSADARDVMESWIALSLANRNRTPLSFENAKPVSVQISGFNEFFRISFGDLDHSPLHPDEARIGAVSTGSIFQTRPCMGR